MALVTASDTAVLTSESSSSVGSSGRMKALMTSRAKLSFLPAAGKSSRISFLILISAPPLQASFSTMVYSPAISKILSTRGVIPATDTLPPRRAKAL